jgi:hypothetical protein
MVKLDKIAAEKVWLDFKIKQSLSCPLIIVNYFSIDLNRRQQSIPARNSGSSPRNKLISSP